MVLKNSLHRPVKKDQVKIATRRAMNRRAQAYYFQYVERGGSSTTIVTPSRGFLEGPMRGTGSIKRTAQLLLVLSCRVMPYLSHRPGERAAGGLW